MRTLDFEIVLSDNLSHIAALNAPISHTILLKEGNDCTRLDVTELEVLECIVEVTRLEELDRCFLVERTQVVLVREQRK